MASLAAPIAGGGKITPPQLAPATAGSGGGRSKGTTGSIGAGHGGAHRPNRGQSPAGSDHARRSMQARLFQLEEACKGMCSKFTSQAGAGQGQTTCT